MKLCPICATSYTAEHRTCPTHGALLVETPELPPGTIIRDCYRIERVLGKGGMGTVYLAEHTLMGEHRALKFLSGSMASNPTFVQRFLQEARASNMLRHPNIAQTLELWQTEDGSFCISMEYVDGPSLRALLEQAPQGLPADRVFAIVRGVAEGLGAAHAKGIVHRDIKPENILLAWGNNTETAKVVDFGIVAMSDSVGRLTQAGHPLLTAEYAAPEQWRGTVAPSEMDGRTDIYALGCMFFEMLTGRLPYFSETYEGWFEQHVHAAPPAPSSVRPGLAVYPGLDALVMSMMAKDRESRPATVWEFRSALDRVAVPLPSPDALASLTAAPVYGGPPPLPPPALGTGLGTGFGRGPGRSRTILEVPGYGAAAEAAWSPPQLPVQRATQPPPLPNAPPPLAAGAYAPGQSAPGSTGTIPLAEWHSVQTGMAGQTGFPPPPIGGNVQGPLQPAGKAGGLSRNQGILLGFLGVLAVVVLVVVFAGRFLANNGTLQNHHPVQPVPDVTPVPGPVPGPVPMPQPMPGPAVVPSPKTRPAVPAAGLDANGTPKQAIAFYQRQQYAQALPLFSQACDKGSADSCDYLGWMYQHSFGVGQNYPRAAALFDRACSGGSTAGCNNLGVMYQDKLGVQQDYPRALALYTRACNANFAAACDNLGYMYENKEGVAQDYVRAVSLYRKACEHGSMNGCKNLGWMYQNKIGVPQDYAKALQLYTKACNGNQATACNNLGVMYEDKQGVAQDYARAARLYQKACDGGNANGCSDLGDLYARGNGVAKDMDKAKELLSKGCKMGNQWGCDRLKKLS